MGTASYSLIIMKGNFQLKLTIFLLFFSFWGLKPTWGQEVDCGNRVEIIKAVPVNSVQNGKLEIAIKSEGTFECELFKVSGAGKVSVGVQEGLRSGVIVFSDLEEGHYKMLVKFNGEEDPLCHLQQLAGISITKE